MDSELYESGWIDPPHQYDDFESEQLKDYCYNWCQYGKLYDDLKDKEYYGRRESYGWDTHGNVYHLSELEDKKKEGIIIKECHRKLVFLKEEQKEYSYHPSCAFLGYIQENMDGNWIAYSINFCVDVTGFAAEVYAVKYLAKLEELIPFHKKRKT